MRLPRPRLVAEDLVPQLNAARRDVEDARATLADAVKRRNVLVVRAVDEGTHHGAVAEAAGLARTRVIAILADSHTEDEVETVGG